MTAASQYSFLPPFDILYLVLFYSLPVAVVLVCQFAKRLVSPTMKSRLPLFSVGFAGAYCLGCALFFIPSLLSVREVSQC